MKSFQIQFLIRMYLTDQPLVSAYLGDDFSKPPKNLRWSQGRITGTWEKMIWKTINLLFYFVLLTCQKHVSGSEQIDDE